MGVEPGAGGCEASRVRIMGIDPGLATGGVGVIEWDAGTRGARLVGVAEWRSAAGRPLAERLRDLGAWLGEQIDLHRPEVVAVEEVFHAHNVRTVLTMAHARGVVLFVPASRGVAVMEYAARLVKQSVAGYGGAEKRQVAEMVRRLLALEAPPRPDHVADALALALCHAHTLGDARQRLAREAAAPRAGGAPAAATEARRRSTGRSRAAWRAWKGPGETGGDDAPTSPAGGAPAVPRPRRGGGA